MKHFAEKRMRKFQKIIWRSVIQGQLKKVFWIKVMEIRQTTSSFTQITKIEIKFKERLEGKLT